MKFRLTDSEWSKLNRAATYCYKQYFKDYSCRKNLIELIHPSGVHGTVFGGFLEQDIVICVTGSNQAKDWLYNLLAWRNRKGFYHGAFTASKLIKNGVFEALDRKPLRTNLLICGHSIGGAIAYILALQLAIQGFQHITLVTFGQPKTGNKNVCDRLLNEGVNYYRVTATLDPIPFVPFGLTHCGRQIKVGGFHGMASYCDAVKTDLRFV